MAKPLDDSFSKSQAHVEGDKRVTGIWDICCNAPQPLTQDRVEESKESGWSAHRSMCLLCALEAEGGTTFTADVHWLAPHICFSLYGVLTPCSRQAG